MSYNYKELSDKAFELHKANKLDDAEKLYKILLDISPQDANILNLYGMLSITKKKYDQAIALLSKAVLYSKSASLIVNLAKAYIFNDELDKGIKLIIEVISNNPYDDDALYTLAIAFKKKNLIDKSIQSYKAVLNANPKHYNAAYNLAIIYRDEHIYSEAIKYANICLDLRPDSEEIYIILSYLYEMVNDIQSAVLALEKAAFINPNQYLYYFNLGVLYSKLNKIESSKKNYIKVLTLKPNNVETLVNLCSLLIEKEPQTALEYILEAKKYEPKNKNVILNLAKVHRAMYNNNDSINVLKEFIESYPDSADAYSLMAANYMDTGDYQTALNYYSRACELHPKSAINQHGRAIALKYLGNIDEAQPILEHLVKIHPDSFETKIALGMLYLSQKDFYKGMELYRNRNYTTIVGSKFKDKLWKPGDDITGKSVLLYSNCGFGDTIMFSRYIDFLSKLSEKVILQTDEALVDFIQANYRQIDVISKSQTIQEKYDMVIPLMDLPYVLKMDFSNIPHNDSYLFADSKIVEKISKLDEFNNDKYKIGLFWQGNKRILKNRSVDISLITDLISDKQNIEFYSLQLESDSPTTQNIVQLNSYIKNFCDTAAILSNLDLVITIDSSVAHLAGAMGIKTYLLLPFSAEWRWFNDDKTTPWYKSVQIFRQKKSGDWKSVLKRINTRLKKI